MCYMWDFIYHPQLWGISDNPGHLMPLRWRRFQSQLVTVFVSAEFSCFKQMNSQSHMDQNAFQMKWPCLLTPGETASYSQHANNADAGSMHVSALSLSLSLACARARERKKERERDLRFLVDQLYNFTSVSDAASWPCHRYKYMFRWFNKCYLLIL